MIQFVGGEGHQAPNLLTTTPTYTHNIEVPSHVPESFAGMTQAMPTAAAGSAIETLGVGLIGVKHSFR